MVTLVGSACVDASAATGAPTLESDALAQVVDVDGEDPARSAADYDAAFPQDRVQRLEIVVTPAQYEAMQDDMTEILGAFGSRKGLPGFPGMTGPGAPGTGGPGAPGGGFRLPEAMFAACAGRTANAACESRSPFGAGMLAGKCTPMEGRLACLPSGGPGMGPPGGPDFGLGTTDLIPRTPRYVEAEVRVNGKVWKHVGVRYKGNSSLAMTWQQGIAKLPLRLNFDKFEDDYPQTKNQKFFGFDSLSLSNNMEDPSLLRAKLANDIFRRAGLPAPASAFYDVYLDTGKGAVGLGIYTAAELPSDDAFLTVTFGSDQGNLYKPSGVGARFETYDEKAFEKENNTAKADYSDVKGLYDALHADRSRPEVWRRGLEAKFDVDGFLHWLAVNTLIQNWDSYGRMPHNYYLYANPSDDGRLSFIPWDQSFALSSGGFGAPLSFALDEITKQWPLIRFLLDDATYRDRYHGYLAEAARDAFEPAATIARFREARAIVAPYVTGPDAPKPVPAQFDSSFEQLLQHVTLRSKAVADYLAKTPPSTTPAR